MFRAQSAEGGHGPNDRHRVRHAEAALTEFAYYYFMRTDVPTPPQMRYWMKSGGISIFYIRPDPVRVQYQTPDTDLALPLDAG